MAWGLGRAVCLWLLLLSVLRLSCRGATVEEDSVAFDLVQRHLQVPDASKLSAAQTDVINRARAGDLDALNLIGKALYGDKRTVFGDPDAPLAAQFSRRLGRRPGATQAAP